VGLILNTQNHAQVPVNLWVWHPVVLSGKELGRRNRLRLHTLYIGKPTPLFYNKSLHVLDFIQKT
jgi:hypothetical protein